jgi:VWFA-related protein
MSRTAVFFCLIGIVAGQQPPANGTADPTLVRLNMIALDASGQPVNDLTASDVRLTDQGKAQRIAFFRRAGAQPAASGNEYSNGGASPHTTAILIDLLNQGRADRIDAARKVGRSLQQLESGESVYLYLLSLEGTLVPIHPIQPQPGQTATPDKTWTQQVEKQVELAMQNVNRGRPVGMSQEDMVKKTYVALETLATQLAAVPGRRDVVWVTNGVPEVFNTKARATAILSTAHSIFRTLPSRSTGPVLP